MDQAVKDYFAGRDAGMSPYYAWYYAVVLKPALRDLGIDMDCLS